MTACGCAGRLAQCGTSASQIRTFLANHFLSLDFGTTLKTRTASEPLLKWTTTNEWQVSTPFFFGISSWSTCMWILSRLSWYRVDCHALWAYVEYVLHLTATKQYWYQYQIFRPCNVRVVNIHMIEILCLTCSQSNPIIYALHIVLSAPLLACGRASFGLLLHEKLLQFLAACLFDIVWCIWIDRHLEECLLELYL